MRYAEFKKVNGYLKDTPFTLSVEEGSLQGDSCKIGTGEVICVEDLIMHVVNGEGTISNPEELENGWGGGAVRKKHLC